MEDLFELFESEAIKVILYHGNRPKFADIIERALKQYAIILQRRRAAYRAKGYVKYTWEVPADRFYKEDTNRVCPKIENHALMPYIQEKQGIFTRAEVYCVFRGKQGIYRLVVQKRRLR